MSTLTRVCLRCGNNKPVTAENWYLRSNGRPTSYCKDCTKQYQRERRARLRARKAIELPDHKVCPGCGENKPADEFYRKADRPDGLYDYCKPCTDERYKQYYQRKKRGIQRRMKQKTRVALRPAEPGFVYLAYMEPNYYKIGKSVDPERRIASIDAFLPIEVRLVHSIKTNQQTLLELQLHDRYAEKRIDNTEWFLLTAEDVRVIKSITTLFFPVEA